jgi:hypothetical protein
VPGTGFPARRACTRHPAQGVVRQARPYVQHLVRALKHTAQWAGPWDVAAGTRAEAYVTTDADFRALKTMLDGLDPDEGWDGLSRYDTPERLTPSEHLGQYQAPDAGPGG